MEADFIVWLFVVGFWLISGLLNRLGRKFQPPEYEMPPEIDPAFAEGEPVDGRSAEGPLDPRRARAEKLERAFREMVQSVEELGVPPAELERPVASEHRTTDSEHRRTGSEHRRTATEHRRTRGEHRRTRGEHRQSGGETSRTSSEHQRTASEHRRGDYAAPPPPPAPPAKVRRRRGARIRLRGRKELARAIVLREILGPPVSMRTDSDIDSI